MKLPKESRHLLKRPFGDLLHSTSEAVEKLLSMSYKRLITVGDVVTAELLKKGLRPDLAIIDFTVMRSSARKDCRKIIEDYSADSINVENPPGHISPELMNAIKTSEPPQKIIVDGEEDLATLPAVLFAPEGSVVIYGQPKEGMVLVKVSEEKKNEFKGLFELFEAE